MLLPVWIIIIVILVCLSLIGTCLMSWQHLKKQTAQLQKHKAQLSQFKRQQQLAEDAQSSAEAANLAKNKYLSGISHELRTPLNVIMGYAQLLENKSASDDPNQQSYHLIRKNCEHLTHLIEGILEFSAIESGKLKVQSDVIDIKQLLTQICHMFASQASQKNISFQSNISTHIPQFVKSDPKRLKQILINLLSNAIKFTHKGGVVFDVSYRHQVATMVITDTGCGIKTDDLERIFQPFERIESTAINTVGTGLGLTIAKLLAELLGGELTVKSRPEQGSEFTLKLMLSAQVEPKISQVVKMAPNSLHRHKILIVDDMVEHRQLTQNILQPYGFEILTTKDAASAKTLINNHLFDLLLLDVAMPNEDGWSLAQWVRAQGNPVKICMLSANPRDNDPQRHPHHQAYLAKPIHINQLLTVVSQLLQLDWEASTQSIESPTVLSDFKLKRKDRLALNQLLEIGHINGIENYLKVMHDNELLSQSELNHLLEPIKQLNLSYFSQIITNHDQ